MSQQALWHSWLNMALEVSILSWDRRTPYQAEYGIQEACYETVRILLKTIVGATGQYDIVDIARLLWYNGYSYAILQDNYGTIDIVIMTQYIMLIMAQQAQCATVGTVAQQAQYNIRI